MNSGILYKNGEIYYCEKSKLYYINIIVETIKGELIELRKYSPLKKDLQYRLDQTVIYF